MISCLLCGLLPHLSAQTNISGIINTYYEVTAFSAANNSMIVTNVTGLASGTEVLVIQMQGATVSQANSTAWGSLTNYNGAGRYELARVCQINGNEIVFDSSLVHAGEYAASGNIQLVSIPEYANATVNAPLTAAPWNGSTGGVLILRATGTLSLDAPIHLNGLGFRGGGYQNASNNCNAFFPPSSFVYINFQEGGRKGEGIVLESSLAGVYGKGSAANGGGGGNNHNAGGGGGGNGGAGGMGGENETSGFARCTGPHPGAGGRSVATANRIFMGGGGGSGHGNNNLGTGGAAGGGIAIIMANTLVAGNSDEISADGLDASSGFSDGVGGGGAGGSIQLAVGSITGNIQLRATGGDGGSVNNEGLNFCMGPGGGGSGGRIVTSAPLPPNVSTNLTGGSQGTSTNIGSNCNASNIFNGATAGVSGSISSSGSISTASANFLCEPLAVVWGEVWAEVQPQAVSVNAMVLFEEEGNTYKVERSLDGQIFESLQLAHSLLSQEEPLHYRWEDQNVPGGRWYYRIQQIDALGRSYYSQTIQVSVPDRFVLKAFPNPLASNQALRIRGSVPNHGILQLQIVNTMGQILTHQNLPLRDHLYVDFSWELPPLPSGSYYVRAQFEGQSWYQLIVMQ